MSFIILLLELKVRIVKNNNNKRIRTRTYADTPTGEYNIIGWSKRLSRYKRESYGPNAVLELDCVSGEAAGLRNGIHLHGGRQEGKAKAKDQRSI